MESAGFTAVRCATLLQNTAALHSDPLAQTVCEQRRRRSRPRFCTIRQVVNTTSSAKPDQHTTRSGNRMRSAEAVTPSTADTIPRQTELSRHPLDPHKPKFSSILPAFARPYPAFEGWFTRIWDPEANFTVAVIMATNYATQESQVTLLFTPSPEDLNGSHSSPNAKYDLRTYAVADICKDAKFTDGAGAENVREQPIGFEWEAPGLGRIKITAHETELNIRVKGYTLEARITNELLWDPDHSENGPEGWAKSMPIPTHWYVYSLGSTAEYEFSGPERALARKGVGLAHQEKNWGQTFPNGHVWFQGFAPDNSAQIIGSAAYFTLGSVKTPYIFALGYRSPAVSIDMRTNDLGTVFKNIEISPLDGTFSVRGVSTSHAIQIRVKADPETLSESILAPMGKVKWESACRETFLAEVEIEVYEHAAWGLVGDRKLVDKRSFKCAGLEFGEDLLTAALEGHK